MVAHGGPHQNHSAYQHTAPITPVTNTAQQPSYQPQYPQQNYPAYQHILAITPVPTAIHQPQYQQQPYQQQQYQQQPYQQDPHQQPYQQQQYQQQPYQQQPYQQLPHRPQAPRPPLEPIPMRYTDLLPTLLDKKLVQTRPASPVPERLLAGYKADWFCAFHQGASGHDTEDCFGLKYAVQRLIEDKRLSFTHQNPNIQTNPLSNHVSMVQDCPKGHLILDIQHVRTPLVPIHTDLCKLALFEHDHAACEVCSIDPRGYKKVKDDIQGLLSQRELTITRKDDEVCVIVPEFNIP